MSSTIPPIVSVDDHLIEPPGVWQDRVPAKYKDVAPRLETLPSDAFRKVGGVFVPNPEAKGPPGAWWHYEDKYYPVIRYIASAGYPPSHDDNVVVTRRGWLTRHQSIVPHARLQSVAAYQGPLERLLGLANVTFHTTGLLHTHAVIHMNAGLARTLVYDEADRAMTSRDGELLR